MTRQSTDLTLGVSDGHLALASQLLNRRSVPFMWLARSGRSNSLRITLGADGSGTITKRWISCVSAVLAGGVTGSPFCHFSLIGSTHPLLVGGGVAAYLALASSAHGFSNRSVARGALALGTCCFCLHLASSDGSSPLHRREARSDRIAPWKFVFRQHSAPPPRLGVEVMGLSRFGGYSNENREATGPDWSM
jgi:hypothetical protein